VIEAEDVIVKTYVERITIIKKRRNLKIKMSKTSRLL